MTDFNRIDTLELEKAKLQLKVQAQRERMSELEDQVADLRVELTLMSQRLQRAAQPNQQELPDPDEQGAGAEDE